MFGSSEYSLFKAPNSINDIKTHLDNGKPIIVLDLLRFILVYRCGDKAIMQNLFYDDKNIIVLEVPLIAFIKEIEYSIDNIVLEQYRLYEGHLEGSMLVTDYLLEYDSQVS